MLLLIYRFTGDFIGLSPGKISQIVVLEKESIKIVLFLKNRFKMLY